MYLASKKCFIFLSAILLLWLLNLGILSCTSVERKWLMTSVTCFVLKWWLSLFMHKNAQVYCSLPSCAARKVLMKSTPWNQCIFQIQFLISCYQKWGAFLISTCLQADFPTRLDVLASNMILATAWNNDPTLAWAGDCRILWILRPGSGHVGISNWHVFWRLRIWKKVR